MLPSKAIKKKYIEVVMRGLWEEEKNLGDHEIFIKSPNIQWFEWC